METNWYKIENENGKKKNKVKYMLCCRNCIPREKRDNKYRICKKNKEISRDPNTPPHTKNKFQSWSAHGQDYFVFELLNRKKEGYFIELGGYDGISISNTYTLEKNYNWKGICIECEPGLFNLMNKSRNCICLNEMIDSGEEQKVAFSNGNGGIVSEDCDNNDKNTITSYHKPKKLEDILDENNSPKVIDYFSLDVEGAEYRILKKFNFEKYKFKILGIERPKKELEQLLKDKGYFYIYDIGGDDFYYHKDFESELNFQKIKYSGVI